MSIPIAGVARRLAGASTRLNDVVARVLASGRVLLGVETEELERELAQALGHRNVVCVASGTDALRLALQALDIGAGDEVLVPAFTAVPTVAAVCASGATPVLVDVDPDSATIDPSAAAGAMTPRSRAIVAVHLYGYPAAGDELRTFGLPVIEDAAQAHGAVTAGSAGPIGYSFYPTKNLGGIGDGGAVASEDDSLAETLRLLRQHGLVEGYVAQHTSGNSRMSEIEAAYLRERLPELRGWNERRARIARRYRTAAPQLRWQRDHPRHVHHQCVLRTRHRDALRAALAEGRFSDGIGIETAVHYPCAISRQPVYRGFARSACAEAEAWAAECVSVPCHPELTDEEVAIVEKALARAAAREDLR